MTAHDLYGMDEQDQINYKHSRLPQPGDYWHECFSPYCVVIGVIRDHVVICTSIKNFPDDTWTWDLSKLEILPLKQWQYNLSYKSNSPMLLSKTVYRCEPQKHSWVKDVSV